MRLQPNVLNGDDYNTVIMSDILNSNDFSEDDKIRALYKLGLSLEYIGTVLGLNVTSMERALR